MAGIIKNIWSLCRIIGLTKLLSDEMFVRLQYRAMMGKKLRLNPPIDFNEKLQWLKLHYRNPLYVIGADKYEVRKLVTERIGEQYLAKCLGVYERVEDIDFAALPDKFVLKGTHGSGWNIICPDKRKIDWPLAQAKMRKWLKKDFSLNGREWQYHEIKPRIICEEFLVDPDYPMLRDYKLFIFKGETKYIWVDFTEHRDGTPVAVREQEVGYSNPVVASDEVKLRNIYDANWNFMPGRGSLYPSHDTPTIARPVCLEEMKTLAKKLAGDFPHCRVDFYVMGGRRIVFGELTFTPGKGCNAFEPQSFCDELGRYIRLPARRL